MQDDDSVGALGPPKSNELNFLSGGGELGQLIREFDWTATSLGIPANWPQNLRMALRIMLTSLQPIWIGWGNELIYLYNDPYKSIIGGKHPWALGKPTTEVWSEIWPDISPLLETALGGDLGTYVEAKLLIMERNGYPEETYYTFSYSPIPNDDGTVGGILCANSDDTQRVIGERQLALLRDLAASTVETRTWQDACAQGMVALSGNARDLPFAMIYTVDLERAALRLDGVSGIERGCRAAPEEIALDDTSLWPIADVLRTHEPVVVDLATRRDMKLPSGPWDRSLTKAVVLPISSMGETGRPGVLVTGLNPCRLYDENYRSFLGLVAGQIASAIGNAQAYEAERRRAEALAEIDRVKTAFFSNISHEFRTPLTLMIGPLEDVLHDDAAAGLSTTQRGRLEIAHRNGVRLLKLVNSLLEFSRIEARRVEADFQSTDLATLTAGLASNFEPATSRAGLALTIDCAPLPREVLVDREMWEKIVLNLLSNAFKFTFSGEIVVRIGLSADGQSAELMVRDTGVGIPEHELPRLFERFHRIEGQQSRSIEGSGIGLALTQELVRLHDGTIHVESRVGAGTSFVVSIPLTGPEGAKERSNAGSRPSPDVLRADAFVEEVLRWLPESQPLAIDQSVDTSSRSEFQKEAHILVVDDNADMRAYVRRLLAARWDVETVSNGLMALDAIRAQKPDLVLTDVMMPGLDGFGLLQELRGDPTLRDLPVILLSARAGEEARVEGLNAGADDYLTKPFLARELIARISANLEMARIRREATRELRESEARFRNMANNAPVMMWVTDTSGQFTYLNRGWCDFTGQSHEEAVGRGAWTMLHPEDRPDAERGFRDANAARQALRIEYRLRRADGVYRWALSAATPRLTDDGEFVGYIGSVIDIEDRKAAEEVLRETNDVLEGRIASAVAERAEAEAQLRQSQKMEAVGKLTGGVAHDFNNVLQVISGNVQLLTRDFKGNLQAEHRLQSTMAAIGRASKLVSHLLAFGRRQPLAPKVVNIGRLIQGIDDMLRRALGEGIEIETIVGGGLWNTFVDTVQVENALLNLAINARDAMDRQGKLTIEAGNGFLDDAYAARHPEVDAGQYVVISVTDTGSGIPPELIDRVFEPFFTTKAEGHGSGLGLSMVYGFVKQSGGHIKIYSEPDQGTTVRLYLPRSKEKEDVEIDVGAGPATGGTETILVVEDDEEVRRTVVEMLSELGYRVLRARDAQSGLAIVESGVPIDLLFTDVVMPGALRSPELARKARERLPKIAVLFTSGYTENAIVHGGRLDDGLELLSKPYTREALARKVRHALRNQQQRNEGLLLSMWPSSARTRPEPVATRRLRVLVVEDDDIIRMTTVDMISDLGHHVIEAASADAALVLCEKHTPDVMVTDIGLPGVSGVELATQAIGRQPGLRVVFASGYDSLPRLTMDEALADAVVLRKPYSEKDLDKVLKSVMSFGSKSSNET